jgi:transposase
MEEINRFVVLAQSGRFSVTDLCEQFGISRKTSYKHLERYAALGLAGLRPRSHRPHSCPQRAHQRRVYRAIHARMAQRSLAEELRGLARRSSGPARTTSSLVAA